jgi:flavorubredoxin
MPRNRATEPRITPERSTSRSARSVSSVRGLPSRGRGSANVAAMGDARIDEIVDKIYRISIWSPEADLTFNQFLIDDEAPTLIHTGRYDDYDAVAAAVGQVLDPARLANLVLLHWEGDENGGMDRFMSRAPRSQLIGSALSISLNAAGFGLHDRTRGFRDGETLELGQHRLRFLETPHVHHWDSMMVVEEQTGSLFPSDLFLQPGEQPPVTSENLAQEMLEAYRMYGIFAHEDPVRAAVHRAMELRPDWIHAMHGATITGDALPHYSQALLEEQFAYRGELFGRPIGPRQAPRT